MDARVVVFWSACRVWRVPRYEAYFVACLTWEPGRRVRAGRFVSDYKLWAIRAEKKNR
jgi:hypothetical protein